MADGMEKILMNELTRKRHSSKSADIDVAYESHEAIHVGRPVLSVLAASPLMQD